MFTIPDMKSYAVRPEGSRGRKLSETESATRTLFQRDRDRVIHSSAFRRLKPKTQVFVAHEGDAYRTRLTHSLEVSQVARSLCRNLGLCEDLGEALALAHDLGHPPFGHAGEDALNAVMEPYGGFDHNEQTFRILTILENRYAAFDGLNLTWETLEGIAKHNGPLSGPNRVKNKVVPVTIAAFDAEFSLDLDQFSSAEAQAAAIADDIAYNNHDIDDGISAGLFSIEDLEDLPLVGDVFAAVKAEFPALDRDRVVNEAVRRLIGYWIDDLTTETRRRVELYKPGSVADVRALEQPLVAFSEQLDRDQRALRAFLYERMHKHYKVNRMRSQGKRILKELFELFLTEPETLPDMWRYDAEQVPSERRARLICDYLAGMTDNYAIELHRRLCSMESML